MAKSKLATYTNIANNYGNRRLYPVTKIAIHHMAGKMTARQCADYFARTDRNASSNYTIGWDGSIALSVPEEYRAYTTSSSWCDERAITIEVSNEDNNGGDWKITDKAYNALLDLVTDICKRYNIKDCSYTGDKDGVLQKHEWYAYTNCPGKYLGSKFKDISNRVNARLRGNSTSSTNSSQASLNFTKGLYEVTIPVLNVRSGAGLSYSINRTVKKGDVYTIVEVKNEWGKLKSGAGWINLPLCKKVGEVKENKPSLKSISTIANEVINGKWGNGSDRVTRLKNAGYNYNKVQDEVNKILGSKKPSKSVNEIAKEVINGKWGNGSDRVNRLTNAGYNYDEIQNEVNRILR